MSLYFTRLERTVAHDIQLMQGMFPVCAVPEILALSLASLRGAPRPVMMLLHLTRNGFLDRGSDGFVRTSRPFPTSNRGEFPSEFPDRAYEHLLAHWKRGVREFTARHIEYSPESLVLKQKFAETIFEKHAREEPLPDLNLKEKFIGRLCRERTSGGRSASTWLQYLVDMIRLERLIDNGLSTELMHSLSRLHRPRTPSPEKLYRDLSSHRAIAQVDDPTGSVARVWKTTPLTHSALDSLSRDNIVAQGLLADDEEAQAFLAKTKTTR